MLQEDGNTANIPCQQRDWWAESVRLSTQGPKNYLGKLPTEIWDTIVDIVEEFPLELKEARALRQELMNERTRFTRILERTIVQFSLLTLKILGSCNNQKSLRCVLFH